jgi:hypothetical protein
VSVNFYLSMPTISCSQLLRDVCSSKSLLIEIEKEKTHAHHTDTPAHTHTTQAHTHAHTHAQPHTTQMHTRHAHAHTAHMHTRHAHAHTAHTPHAMHTHHAQAHTAHTHTPNIAQTMHTCTAQRKKIEGKRGQSMQTIISRSWSCYLCQTHLSSSKG